MVDIIPLDTSLLPPADLEFVVMTDTHHMLDPGEQKIEFESRRHQSTRAAYALAKVASLPTACTIHLGDLVQEFPEGPGFEKSLTMALQQFEMAGLAVHQVAGNHDVGDKPDPTMPTEWVTDATLDAYHQRFGPSWTSWNVENHHFVVINSQILNGPLAAVEEQRAWLEADLAEHGSQPTFIFQHLSPFLVDEDEPGLGHYDNIDEPARGWLLNLIRTHNVKLVFSGHSHFGFLNRIGSARSYLVPSTAFTRPGFCEVFSSAPPPERGRDDAAKLGFFFVRIHDGEPRVHFVRTSGKTHESAQGSTELVTAVTADLPTSPLGITLRSPLAPRTEVPIAWQSTVRQPVRNDFPLLACLELGVRHVRVPASDLRQGDQRERLRLLREEGVSITAFWIWSSRSPVLAEAADASDILDTVELQLPNTLVPDDACLAAIEQLRSKQNLLVSLAPLLPHEHVVGKQHARTRIGYHLNELETLGASLRERNARVDRVLCRVDATEQPMSAMHPHHQAPSAPELGTIDWAIEFVDGSKDLQPDRASSALIEAALQPGCRLYLEPLVDMDRTMDAPPGLLTRLCNPNPVFGIVRTLNTLLFAGGDTWRLAGSGSAAYLATELRRLLIPMSGTTLNANDIQSELDGWRADGFDDASLVMLETGTIRQLIEGESLPDVGAQPLAFFATRPATT